ncbi:MAG: CdaR family protein, partial [Fretibacterium sp.]|nr:CdaR family protein [Fretibacterium sp.]
VLPQDIPDGQYLEGVEIVPKEIAIRGGEKDISKIGAIQIQPTVQELQSGKELLLPVKLSQSEPFDEEVALEPSQVRMRASLVRGLPKKKVPVNLRLSGKPSSDYELKAVVTDPSEVHLEGPASRLSQISSVETETVDISWLSADQMLVVPLKAPNVKGVSILNVKSVRLSVHLEPAKATTQFSNIPVDIRAGSGESEWAAAPSVVVVTVEGLPSRIADIRPEDVGLQAYVDLSNIFVDSAALPVRVEIASEDLKVVKIEPPTVTVSTAEGSVGR